jgi:uncharacterized membrane protein
VIRTEIQRARDIAVFDFLSDNRGSILEKEGENFAIIHTGGLDRSQVKFHIIASVVTCGLWLPLFWTVAMLRAPRLWLLFINDNGKLTITELQNES